MSAAGFVAASAAQEFTPLLPNLSGTWAVLQVTSQIGAVPILGERTRTATTVALSVVDQEGATLHGTESACSTALDLGTSLVTMEIPATFIASLPATPWDAELSWTGVEWRFDRPWVTTVNGAVLDDPENDPLPTSPDDPRVVDQDGDGKPGLTVRITIIGFISGEVYVVQRDRSRLVGTVVSADAIDGLLEWTSEQSVLGASSSAFLGGTAARLDPIPEHSFFRARRMTAATTCTDLVAAAALIFGR
jgi:hypothetical protein